MDILKVSTAVTIVMGPMLDSTDGNSPETALTIAQADIRLSKNGGAFAQTNNVAGATHMEVGNFSVPLDTTDTGTLGKLRVAIHESGALAVWREFTIVPANVYDTLVLGTDVLTADVTQWLGTAAATPTVAGVPEVDVTHWHGSAIGAPTVAGVPEVDLLRIGGDAQSRIDLKDFADSGYDSATNKVQGVVLVDTTTSNTDMVGTDNAALAATALTDATWTDAKAAFIDHSIATVDTNLDTLLTRITAPRAGYLDNLSAGAVALAATALTDVTWTDAKAAFLDHSIATVDTNVDTLLTRITAAVALASALATAQTDLDTITGTDGVTLATAQALYAPNKVVPDVAGTAAGLHSTTDGKVDAVQTDSTAIKAKTDNLPSGIAKNVALSNFQAYMVLSSDHVTAATGKTLTGTISKDGATFASLTNAITEIANGLYKVNLTQTEMNADVIALKFTETDCDQRVVVIHTT